MKRLKEKLKNLKLQQRMFLVYLLGGLLPLIFIYFYMVQSFASTLASQERAGRAQELRSSMEALTDAMLQAENLSEELSYDTENGQLIFRNEATDYRWYSAFLNRVRKFYPAINNICVYVLERKNLDNYYFKLITDSIRSYEWYQDAVRYNGLPSWSYTVNLQSSSHYIRLARTLYTEDRQIAGVISITIDSSILYNILQSHTEIMAVLHNDETLISTNRNLSATDQQQIYDIAHNHLTSCIFRGEKMRCVAETIRPRYSFDEYTFLSLRPRDEIISAARLTAMRSLIPMLVGVIIMITATLLLTNWFTGRIRALGDAMEEVTASGTLSEYKTISFSRIGESHDEIWELYKELKQMVENMQRLTEESSRQKLEREQLYSRQRDVEFKMLTAQINPHFLYNTMETIRMLALINGSEEIADISVNLTRLLRGSLEAGGELRSLAWELSMIDCYIRIQNYRFGDRITAKVICDIPREDTEKYKVLPFVVQPFVENAYVHAMEEVEDGGEITVSVSIDEDLYLYVEDNGHGMRPDEISSVISDMNDYKKTDRTHIGIANVNQRIRLRFGEGYGVRFTSVEGSGTRVTIHMPAVM